MVLRKAWLVARDSSVEGGLAELFVLMRRLLPFQLPLSCRCLLLVMMILMDAH